MGKLLCMIRGHKWMVRRQTQRFKGNATVRTKIQEIQCARCGLKRR